MTEFQLECMKKASEFKEKEKACHTLMGWYILESSVLFVTQVFIRRLVSKETADVLLTIMFVPLFCGSVLIFLSSKYHYDKRKWLIRAGVLKVGEKEND